PRLPACRRAGWVGSAPASAARRPRADPPARGRGGAASVATPSDTESSRTRMSVAGSVEPRERLRLFVAFRLPEDALRGLTDWQRDELRAPEGVRVVPPENLHATIAFR